ncbi:MAG: nicotinate phosphoribosyltransferase [Patescibacteria group bacterium]|nr:nicotinate phosphoribosyltransferase [Patescibacteria group bacterium]MDD5164877.1 nicotinate phosphoribosyltransferase [Patescibacteria group bacterium]MDD5534665.1 nicotinate phosphoribosyltransferase [Patescibacteria group bacterium]
MEHIINSLLDLDYYKLTMAQVSWKYYPEVPVQYSFINRTARVNLSDYISLEVLKSEFDHVKTLKYLPEEIDYLRGLKIFEEGFLNFLNGVRLDGISFRTQPKFEIEVEGNWSERIFWETIKLCIVTELYNRVLVKRSGMSMEEVWREGERRLDEKIRIIQKHPEIKFIDFGTRRRFSRDWHDYAARKLKNELSPEQFLGVSNVYLAKKYGLASKGTYAHEKDMILYGVFYDSKDPVRESHNRVMEIWWETYGKGLSIALSDTYGSDFFLENFTLEQAQNWNGLRQDSGDPFRWGEKVFDFYLKKTINPTTKTVIFSDGLDITMMLKLSGYFRNCFNVLFGWGTNLTNDCGFEALSLVSKPTYSCGHPVIKLSDNIAKATGDLKEIERVKRILSYTNDFNETCVY